MKLLQLSKLIYNWGAGKAVEYIFMFFLNQSYQSPVPRLTLGHVIPFRNLLKLTSVIEL